jgi:N-acetylmuramoyl-L-alanine amidase
MRIVLDSGHGGQDSGAIGPSGVPEKDIALAVAVQIGGFLAAKSPDIDILYTRMDDIYVSLPGRCEIANDSDADVFVSIHCNAAESPLARGFEMWTSPGSTGADLLASRMWNRFRTTFPDRKGRLDSSDGDEDKEARFAVLVGTKMPAVLVELGFITNTDEERWLLSPSEQVKMAAALSSAIMDWRGDHGSV